MASPVSILLFRSWRPLAAAVLVAAALCGGLARGQSLPRLPPEPTLSDSGSTVPSPGGPSEARLAELEREVRALRAQIESLRAPALSEPGLTTAGFAAERTTALTLDEKPSGKSADTKPAGGKSDGKKPASPDLSREPWTVKLGGHTQLDYITWASASPAIPDTKNYFEFRRLRLVADGTGYGVYDFRLQMTLEPETVGETLPLGTVLSPDVKDAYFTINEVPVLGRVRIGNFFVPFSLEQVTNDTNNIFMERSIPSQGIFSPDREVGIACYNCTEDKSLSWAYGMFIDSISEGLKERIDDNQGYRISGRLNWVPYFDEPSNGRYAVHTGVGVLYTDDQDHRLRLRARPQIHEGPRIIDSGVLNVDSFTTGNLEGAIVWGQVTLQSEAFLSSISLLNGDTAAANGCYAHLSYFLTGENRIYDRFGQHGAQFARNQPYSNVFFVPGCCSWGAWEAKVRWSHLDLNDLGKGQYNDLTVGFNWYWSDRVRVMFDWIHPVTSGSAVFGATQADILAMRFDWNW